VPAFHTLSTRLQAILRVVMRQCAFLVVALWVGDDIDDETCNDNLISRPGACSGQTRPGLFKKALPCWAGW